MCSQEIFTKKCRQQQIFDSDLKGAWHYDHVTFTPIAKNFMLYCRLIYMLSILCVRLTIKVKVGIPESFKVGWYPSKKTGSSHLKRLKDAMGLFSRPTLSPTRLQKLAKIVGPLILRHDTFLAKDKCWQDKLAWAWVRISTLEKSLRHVAW